MNDQALGFILLAIVAFASWMDGRRQLRAEEAERAFWKAYAQRCAEGQR